MPIGMDRGSRAINGTWGEVWLDGELVGECYGLQIKWTVNKEDVKMCGRMEVGKKVTGASGTGTIKLHKTNSRLLIKYAEKIRKGIVEAGTIISKLADPDSYGTERIAVKDVMFDELVLADWEAGVIGKSEYPFTFGDFEPLDMIEVM